MTIGESPALPEPAKKVAFKRVSDQERDDRIKAAREKAGNTTWTTQAQVKFANNLDVFWLIVLVVFVFLAGVCATLAVMALMVWGFKTPTSTIIAVLGTVGGAIMSGVVAIIAGKLNMSTAPGIVAQKMQMVAGVVNQKDRERPQQWDDDGNTIRQA